MVVPAWCGTTNCTSSGRRPVVCSIDEKASDIARGAASAIPMPSREKTNRRAARFRPPSLVGARTFCRSA